jgi:hypothetical protein
MASPELADGQSDCFQIVRDRCQSRAAIAAPCAQPPSRFQIPMQFHRSDALRSVLAPDPCGGGATNTARWQGWPAPAYHESLLLIERPELANPVAPLVLEAAMGIHTGSGVTGALVKGRGPSILSCPVRDFPFRAVFLSSSTLAIASKAACSHSFEVRQSPRLNYSSRFRLHMYSF